MSTITPQASFLKEFYDCGIQINYETVRQALKSESHNLGLPVTELFAHECEYCPSVHAYNKTHTLGDVVEAKKEWIVFRANLFN